MSFGESFVTLSAEISDPSRDLYKQIRVRTLRHPLESNVLFCARLLTFCHTYTPSLEFSHGASDGKLPTLIEKDVVGNLLQWIQVGGNDAKKLERSIKSSPLCHHRFYFLSSEEVQKFCHELKGSRTNWISPVKFFLWNETFLSEISEEILTRTQWQISFIDDAIYLDDGRREYAGTIEPVDIWNEYQEAILNV